MTYPKEFYVTTPIIGDKVWLDLERFPSNGKKAHHGPWNIISVYSFGVKIKRENKEAVVRNEELLRMSRSQIRKMQVLKTP